MNPARAHRCRGSATISPVACSLGGLIDITAELKSRGHEWLTNVPWELEVSASSFDSPAQTWHAHPRRNCVGMASERTHGRSMGAGDICELVLTPRGLSMTVDSTATSAVPAPDRCLPGCVHCTVSGPPQSPGCMYLIPMPLVMPTRAQALLPCGRCPEMHSAQPRRTVATEVSGRNVQYPGQTHLQTVHALVNLASSIYSSTSSHRTRAVGGAHTIVLFPKTPRIAWDRGRLDGV